jgi:hypothetical protein
LVRVVRPVLLVAVALEITAPTLPLVLPHRLRLLVVAEVAGEVTQEQVVMAGLAVVVVLPLALLNLLIMVQVTHQALLPLKATTAAVDRMGNLMVAHLHLPVVEVVEQALQAQ